MRLTTKQVDAYQGNGFLTIEKVFSPWEMDHAIQEAHLWQDEFVNNLSEADENWYLDGSTSVRRQVRKRLFVLR